MSVNFDAKLTLDISLFMRNVKTAENAFDNLAKKINNTKVQMPSAQPGTMPTVPGSNPVPQKQQQATDQNVRNMARERYALYDVAAAYQQMAQIAVGSLTAVIGTAADYERAFANVIRTTEFVSIKTGEAARVMRYELMELAADIPVAFGQITEIATIGNQLGIAQKDLTNFTETVAKFATTTDVTVNNAALSFGRIGELLNVSDFNALGSAIAYAGVNAVATETQILSVTKEIATTAKQAKFTAPEVVGLATALSSLGIAPEAARGSIIRSFAAINKAISEGGQNLQNYANISGMSADQFASTWQRSGSEAFNALLKGLQASSDSGQNLDTTLRDLGIRNVRDIQTLQKLGDNYDVYAQSIRDANSAYAEGTFLSEAYGVVQETVAARFQVIQNQISNLFAGLGESTTGPVKALLDVISGLLEELTKLARNPAIQAVVVFATGVLALVAAIASLSAITSLAKASVLAFGTAMQASGAGATAAAAGVGTFSLAVKAAMLTLGRFVLAIGVFVAATEGIGILGDMIQKATAPMDYARRKAEELIGGFVGLQDAITADTISLQENAKAAGMTVEEYAKAQGIILVHTEAIAADSEAIREAKRVRDGLTTILGAQETSIEDVTTAVDAQTIAIGANTQEWIKNSLREPLTKMLTENEELAKVLQGGGFNLNDAIGAAATGEIDAYFNNILAKYQETLKALNPNYNSPIIVTGETNAQVDDLKNSLTGIFATVQLLGVGAGEVANEFSTAGDGADQLEESVQSVGDALRTVVDYANDLSSILSRVTDLKFGKIMGKDEIANGFDRIRESSLGAAEAMEEARLEIEELNADRGTLEYQLSVAERYGDEKRAAKLRADIAKIDGKIADAEKKKADATEKASTALTGGSKAARENRAELLGVVSSYESYIATLARLGRTPSELAGDVEVLKKQFREQAIALGFSESELTDYLKLFDNFGQTVTEAPRDVDIEVIPELTAAEQAILEFTSKKRSTTVTVDADTDPADLTMDTFVDVTWKFDNIIADRIDTTKVDAYIKSWTSKAREINFDMKFDSAQIVRSQATAIYEVYKALAKVKSPRAESYREEYLILNRIANGMATGGYVTGPGNGTSDSIPTNLSNGEFVVKASAVKAYGVDFMNSINQQKFAGSMPGSSSSAAASGTTVAFLSPEDRALLRAVADRPVELYADSRKIAQTANDGNVLIARRGTR